MLREVLRLLQLFLLMTYKTNKPTDFRSCCCSRAAICIHGHYPMSGSNMYTRPLPNVRLKSRRCISYQVTKLILVPDQLTSGPPTIITHVHWCLPVFSHTFFMHTIVIRLLNSSCKMYFVDVQMKNHNIYKMNVVQNIICSSILF